LSGAKVGTGGDVSPDRAEKQRAGRYVKQ